MTQPPTTPSITPTQRFRFIIEGLLRSVGARVSLNLSTGGYPGVGMAQLPWPVAKLISDRFERAARLFAALAERVRLGTARTYPHRASPTRAPAPDDGADRVRPARALAADAPRLPQRAGGVLGLLYWEAAAYAGQLRHQLADPEMVALIQTVPGFARILRPLCRMLKVTPPEGLFPPLPPRRPRRPRAARSTEPAPQPAAEPVVETGARREASSGFWERPRPAEWERRLDAVLARPPRKTA